MTIGLFVGLAGAQDQGDRREGFGGGRFPGRSVGFTALDANGDGVLDAREIAAAPTALAKLDKNADGQLTSDEVRPPMLEGRGRRGPEFERRGRGGPEGERGEEGGPGNVVEDTVKTLMAFDANGDGKLSKDELPGRFQGIFDRGDEDKDGFLTPAEIRKVAAAQAAPPASNRFGGRGEAGGREEGFRREMNFIRFDPVLAAVDTNGDGILSTEELRNAPVSIRKLDHDGDGKVTREEAMPFRGRGGRGPGF